MNNYIGADILRNKRLKLEVGLRILTEREKKELLRFNNNKKLIKKYIYGRWVAKEALIKLTDKKYIFSEFEIINNLNGKPEVYVKKVKSKSIELTISHEQKYTIAIAIYKYK